MQFKIEKKLTTGGGVINYGGSGGKISHWQPEFFAGYQNFFFKFAKSCSVAEM